MNKRFAALVLAMFVGSACDMDVVTETRELRVGDQDPHAPPGWPLAVGDEIPVGFCTQGWDEALDYWEGNFHVNWVDGVPYTMKWSYGFKRRMIYDGHVPAEPIPPLLDDDSRRIYPLMEEEWARLRDDHPDYFYSEEHQQDVALVQAVNQAAFAYFDLKDRQTDDLDFVDELARLREVHDRAQWALWCHLEVTGPF